MKPLIVANWKMNPSTIKEVKFLFNSVKKEVKGVKNAEVVICPPFVYLPILRTSTFAKDRGGFILGSQDCFWEDSPTRGGAFTGEISPTMLKNFGVKYVIIGHSERRALGETDEMINKKLKAALKARLKPILCVGETAKEREKGKTFKILKTQLEKDLKSISSPKYKILNIAIAYEPVWAIGTGKPCSLNDAKKVFSFLRKILKKNRILYGGSVDSENAFNYIKEANFQGFIVGGASLKSKKFVEIVRNVS